MRSATQRALLTHSLRVRSGWRFELVCARLGDDSGGAWCRGQLGGARSTDILRPLLWSLFRWCAVGLDSASFRWVVQHHGWGGVYSTWRLADDAEHERWRVHQVGVRTTWLVENSVEELRDGKLLMLFRTHDTGFIYSVCLHEPGMDSRCRIVPARPRPIHW
jgi:hypothetical protein